MTSTFLNEWKNSGRLSIVLTLLFFGGMLASLYQLVTLPHQLAIHGELTGSDAAWRALATPFTATVLTFAFAIGALHSTRASRRERVVFLERRDNKSVAATGETDEATATVNDLVQFEQHQDESVVLQNSLNRICAAFEAGQGAIFLVTEAGGKKILQLRYGFAHPVTEAAPRFEWAEGMVGQAAAQGATLYVDEVPEGYITIMSGLGIANPRFLTLVPIKKDNATLGVLEIATFQPLSESQISRLEEAVQRLSDKVQLS